jgi:DNA helicase HerA-like ATPase
VGIGAIVVVRAEPESRRPEVFGVVVEGFSYSDLESALQDAIGRENDPARRSARGERPEIVVYTAAVLRQLPEEPVQPVHMGQVFLADDMEVAVALRTDSFLRGERRTGIPVGVYTAGGSDHPVYLDADFLVGPEAAHLNISGVSGLATKTSAVEWLLASLFAHFPAEKGTIAALCFNVKGADLCFLDQEGAITARDRQLYDRLGVPATPFANVNYFAPWNARGTALNSLRSHELLAGNVQPLTWGLSEVLQYAEVLLNRDDLDVKADALIDFIREKVLGRDFQDPLLQGRRHNVRNFSELEAWFRDLVQALEASGRETWRTHHAATIRKVRNRLSNISTRCAGLVTDDGIVSDLPFGSFEDRAVYVVDVANLEEDAQDLVFARVVTVLREHLERRSLGVDHLVVFVDEMNRYAAADSPDTHVRRMLLEISERGRHVGLVLFGAQQFRSQVHKRVTGNAGTSLFGRMDGDELASPVYSHLSPSVRTRLATLEKGQLMVRHPHFAQPVFVRFPRPAIMNGREGVERFPQPDQPSLDVSVLRSLRTLDPSVAQQWVVDIIASHREADVIRARNRTLLARPSDVRSYFAAALPAAAPVRVAKSSPVRSLVSVPDSDDPYSA